jgi:hypothetical protein
MGDMMHEYSCHSFHSLTAAILVFIATTALSFAIMRIVTYSCSFVTLRAVCLLLLRCCVAMARYAVSYYVAPT